MPKLVSALYVVMLLGQLLFFKNQFRVKFNIQIPQFNQFSPIYDKCKLPSAVGELALLQSTSCN